MKSPRRFAKLTLLATICLSMTIAPIQGSAGFLEDFVQGSSVNISQPAVVQTQSMNLVSGGGMYARFPNQSLDLFTFSPPSIKAGCSGIDMYLGAFGFPTKDQMVAFLRNVGQAAGGIAFSIALKALSPDLDDTISKFSTMITSMTQNYKNACAAAQTLWDTQAGRSMANNIWNAGRSVRQLYSGEVEIDQDNNNFNRVFSRVTGAEYQNAAGTRTNTRTGQSANPPPAERNVTWWALANAAASNDPDFANNKDYLNVLANMIGTVIIKADATASQTQDPTGAGEQNPSNSAGGNFKTQSYKPAYESPEAIKLMVYGKNDPEYPDAGIKGPVAFLQCPLADDVDSQACKSPNVLTQVTAIPGVDTGLLKLYKDAANSVIGSIRNRSVVDSTKLQILASSRDVDLLKIVNLAGGRRGNFHVSAILASTLEMAAFATATRLADVALLKASSAFTAAQNDNDPQGASLKGAYEGLNQNINKALEGVRSERRDVLSRAANIQNQTAALREIERAMYADMNYQMAMNRNFGNAR